MSEPGGRGDEPDRDPEELLSVKEAAAEIGYAESTTWELLRLHDVPRFRLRGRGKTTFVRRGDVLDAYRAPMPVNARERERGGGKVAA